MTSPIAELRSVGARIGTTAILRDVDLRVLPGEVIGLFGANGAGKSTLLRVLATLHRPDAGEGWVLGASLDGPERFEVRRRIGLIGHVPGLYPELTLSENLAFRAKLTGVPVARVDEVLRDAGLARVGDRTAASCSHGTLRRVELAAEMMRRPLLVLLDEPHSALDASSGELVGDLVDSVTSAGGAAVVVSHDRSRVEALATRAVELVGGGLS